MAQTETSRFSQRNYLAPLYCPGSIRDYCKTGRHQHQPILQWYCTPSLNILDFTGVQPHKIVSNPFPTQLNLSDLIGNDMITEDNSSSEENSSLWLANPHQEKADNVQILKSSGWSTYWHDGSNLSISEAAKISARAGSGLEEL